MDNGQLIEEKNASPETSYAVRTEHLSYAYDRVPVLLNINLQVEHGAFLGLIEGLGRTVGKGSGSRPVNGVGSI